MKILDLIQGSPEWLAARAKHLTASEAPAMLGLSKYKSRQDLLREKATGYTPDVDANTQRLFDAGHDSEAKARPLAEQFLGEDLYPVTGALEVDGLPLLASMDGLTMDESTVWENKLSSSAVLAMIESGDLDGTYWPQVEQQLLVSGASRCLFTACDGEKITGQLWYESKPERRAQLIAGWKQFVEDVKGYQHVETAPRAVAEHIEDLPALAIEIVGTVVSSNLVPWRDSVLARIASINTTLTTDQDFANAEATVKFLDEGEKRIKMVKAQAQSQATDIDTLFKALDEISAKMKSTRTTLSKMVEERKVSIRSEIKAEAEEKLRQHIAGLNKRIGSAMMPNIVDDFAGAMRSKKTVKSLRDAVEAELARCKLAANEIADRIDANLNNYAEIAVGYEFLFRDLATLAQKDAEAFEAIVTQRIDNHAKEEAKNLEAVREKIRAEEERNAAAKAKAEAELIAKQQRELDAAEDAAIVATPAAQPSVSFHDVATATAREVFKPAEPTHTGITGSARLLDRLNDLARMMTEAELSELCIRAAHILENRRAVA